MARTRSTTAKLLQSEEGQGEHHQMFNVWLYEDTIAEGSTTSKGKEQDAEVQVKQTFLGSRNSMTVGKMKTTTTKVVKSVSRSKSTRDTSSSSKRGRINSRYADPSKYAHLPELRDILEPNLICVFIGFNPGIRTATAGHAYAHPSNLFWKLLHSSGLTDRRCRPEEDGNLPRLYALGNTNIVSRPTRNEAELAKYEMAAGTPILEAKIRDCKPEAVCIVGKGIWEAIWRFRYGRPLRSHEFRYGWQDESENMGKMSGAVSGDGEGEGLRTKTWNGAKVFVATSTSGLSASLRPAEKEAIWRPLGEWVQRRRRERGQVIANTGLFAVGDG